MAGGYKTATPFCATHLTNAESPSIFHPPREHPRNTLGMIICGISKNNLRVINSSNPSSPMLSCEARCSLKMFWSCSPWFFDGLILHWSRLLPSSIMNPQVNWTARERIPRDMIRIPSVSLSPPCHPDLGKRTLMPALVKRLSLLLIENCVATSDLHRWRKKRRFDIIFFNRIFVADQHYCSQYSNSKEAD